jgi:hypothetical protein
MKFGNDKINTCISFILGPLIITVLFFWDGTRYTPFHNLYVMLFLIVFYIVIGAFDFALTYNSIELKAKGLRIGYDFHLPKQKELFILYKDISRIERSPDSFHPFFITWENITLFINRDGESKEKRIFRGHISGGEFNRIYKLLQLKIRLS